MNPTQLIKTMNNPRFSLNDRIEAATQLWELQNRITKNLKKLKEELSLLSEKEGEDLEIISNDGLCIATVERQPPTPKVDTLDLEALREGLGEELFNRYIAHSYTLRWSEFKLAPQEIRDQFFNTPGLEVAQTYQVKFKRTNRTE